MFRREIVGDIRTWLPAGLALCALLLPTGALVFAATVIFSILFIVVAINDYVTLRVPDEYSFGGIIATLILIIGFAGRGLGTDARAMAIGAVLALAGLGAFHLVAKGGLGLGDVKLAPSLGAFIGLHTPAGSPLFNEMLAVFFVAAFIFVPWTLLLNWKRGLPWRSPSAFAPSLVVGTFAAGLF